MIGDTFTSGNVPTQIAETVVVRIPKSDSPTSIMDFRPISFCTVISKQVSKILVNRIRPHLDTIIGPLQSSFISNRGTGDNAIIPWSFVGVHRKKCIFDFPFRDRSSKRGGYMIINLGDMLYGQQVREAASCVLEE